MIWNSTGTITHYINECNTRRINLFHHKMDQNRELRSMIFSVIHIPPLPSIVSKMDREDNTLLDDSAVESSHSIIGSMLEWTAMVSNQALNDKRMKMQRVSLDKFKSDMKNLDPINCPINDLYNFYCHYTREWLCTYSTLGNSMRFMPLDYVLMNDKTHENMRGYTKAQYHLFTDGNETLKLKDSVTFADLLRKCAQWTKEMYEAEDYAAEVRQLNKDKKTEDNSANPESISDTVITELQSLNDINRNSITVEPEKFNALKD